MLNKRDYLTTKEASDYLGISTSLIYKLTHRKALPYYKPSQKLNYFLKTDLDDWVLRNRVSTSDEIDSQAVDYVNSIKGGEHV